MQSAKSLRADSSGLKPARNDKDEEGFLSAYILLAGRPSAWQVHRSFASLRMTNAMASDDVGTQF
jgi:hypothetical protein